MTKARRFFLDKAQYLFVINLGEGIFEAVVPTAIVGFRKSESHLKFIPAEDLRDCTPNNLREALYTPAFRRLPYETLSTAPNNIFNFNPGSASLVNKLSSRCKPFEAFCDDIANGISTSCDNVYILPIQDVKSLKLEDYFCKPCIRGGQFGRFLCPTETGDRVLYITDNFKEKTGKHIHEYLSSHKSLLINKCVEKKSGTRDWKVLFRARYEGLFRKPKIIIRQTGDSIVAAVDERKGYYCIDSVNVALVKISFTEQIFFLLGLLNSKLLTFVYQAISQESGRVLAQVKPQRLKMLPIAEGTPKERKEISNLVRKMMRGVANGQDMAATESEINQKTYALYQLTESEIRMVENVTGPRSRDGRKPDNKSDESHHKAA